MMKRLLLIVIVAVFAVLPAIGQSDTVHLSEYATELMNFGYTYDTSSFSSGAGMHGLGANIVMYTGARSKLYFNFNPFYTYFYDDYYKETLNKYKFDVYLKDQETIQADSYYNNRLYSLGYTFLAGFGHRWNWGTIKRPVKYALLLGVGPYTDMLYSVESYMESLSFSLGLGLGGNFIFYLGEKFMINIGGMFAWKPFSGNIRLEIAENLKDEFSFHFYPYQFVLNANVGIGWTW